MIVSIFKLGSAHGTVVGSFKSAILNPHPPNPTLVYEGLIFITNPVNSPVVTSTGVDIVSSSIISLVRVTILPA